MPAVTGFCPLFEELQHIYIEKVGMIKQNMDTAKAVCIPNCSGEHNWLGYRAYPAKPASPKPPAAQHTEQRPHRSAQLSS